MLRSWIFSGAVLITIFVVGEAPSFPVPPSDMTKQIVVSDGELATNVDRRQLLRNLFKEVTKSAQTDQERVIAFVNYLQDYIFHPSYAPVDSDGTAVYDPVWMLQHRIAQCAQVNRLLVDGLTSGGYRARLIQLNSHVAAEAYYVNGWHYVDVDALVSIKCSGIMMARFLRWWKFISIVVWFPERLLLPR
jgi:hypothetical protein